MKRALTLVVLLFASQAALNPAPAVQPNVLLIISDDLMAMALSPSP